MSSKTGLQAPLNVSPQSCPIRLGPGFGPFVITLLAVVSERRELNLDFNSEDMAEHCEDPGERWPEIHDSNSELVLVVLNTRPASPELAGDQSGLCERFVWKLWQGPRRM